MPRAPTPRRRDRVATEFNLHRPPPLRAPQLVAHALARVAFFLVLVLHRNEGSASVAVVVVVVFLGMAPLAPVERKRERGSRRALAPRLQTRYRRGWITRDTRHRTKRHVAVSSAMRGGPPGKDVVPRTHRLSQEWRPATNTTNETVFYFWRRAVFCFYMQTLGNKHENKTGWVCACWVRLDVGGWRAHCILEPLGINNQNAIAIEVRSTS
jgi:hypothetical protein